VSASQTYPSSVFTSNGSLASHQGISGLRKKHLKPKSAQVVDAVMYLNDATFITGEVLHVDGGVHAGKW
jgi:hypothetical protein